MQVSILVVSQSEVTASFTQRACVMDGPPGRGPEIITRSSPKQYRKRWWANGGRQVWWMDTPGWVERQRRKEDSPQSVQIQACKRNLDSVTDLFSVFLFLTLKRIKCTPPTNSKRLSQRGRRGGPGRIKVQATSWSNVHAPPQTSQTMHAVVGAKSNKLVGVCRRTQSRGPLNI